MLAFAGHGNLDAALAVVAVAIVFYRAILRLLLAIFAIAVLAALGAGAYVLFQVLHL